MQERVMLFSLSSNYELASEIAKAMNMELSSCEMKRFADGEVNVQINETVRGADCFVIQSTCPPVNDNLMELLIMCDALKRASAKSISVVIPYYGYSRSDKKSRSRMPITSKLIADMLEKSGASRVVYMDIHSTQTQGFFNCPVDNLLSIPIFASYLQMKKLENVVIVSPDHNGTTRAREYGKHLQARNIRSVRQGKRNHVNNLKFEYITQEEFNNIKLETPELVVGDFFKLKTIA